MSDPAKPTKLLHSSYSDIIIEREVLMQKYIHLVQIVETEKVAANQLRTQLEDQDTEIERLKAEVQYAWDVPFNGLFSNV